MNSVHPNVEIALLQKKDIAEAAKCLATSFCQRESFANSLGLTEADLSSYMPLVAQNMISHEVSYGAWDKEKKTLVGCILAKDYLAPPTPGVVEACPKVKPIRGLLKELGRKYDEDRKISKGEIIEVYVAAVYPAWSKRGIYQSLRLYLQEKAKEKGYKVVVGMLSSASTQHVLIDRFGQRVVGEIFFDSYVYEGERVFQGIKSPKSCIMVEGLL